MVWTAVCTVHCTPLQNLSHRAITITPCRPTASLAWRPVYIADGFVQKNEARSVGGRGISAFSSRFFLGRDLSRCIDGVCIVCSFFDRDEDCVYHTQHWSVGRELMRSREVIELIEADGWFEVAVKGSHHQFKHPTKKGRVTVPHPKSEIAKGTLHNILKSAGLK